MHVNYNKYVFDVNKIIYIELYLIIKKKTYNLINQYKSKKLYILTFTN